MGLFSIVSLLDGTLEDKLTSALDTFEKAVEAAPQKLTSMSDQVEQQAKAVVDRVDQVSTTANNLANKLPNSQD